MKNNQKKEYGTPKARISLLLVSLAFGALAVFIGPIMLPPAVAFIAAQFSLTAGKRLSFPFVALSSAAPVAIGAIFGGFSLYFGILASLLGLIIGFMYSIGRSKAETVCIALIVFIAVSALGLYLRGALDISRFDISSVFEHYKDLYSAFRSEVITEAAKESSRLDAVSVYGSDRDALLASLPEYLDSLAYLSVSIVSVIGFILIGISCKIFSRLVFKYSENGKRVLLWRFSTSNVFVVFFIAVLIARFFAEPLTPFGISLANFYAFFNIVYAYIGFNFVIMLLSQKMKYGLSVLAVVAALLLLTSVAVSILAMFGVVFVFITNKVGGFASPPRGGNGDKRSDEESEN